MINKTDVTNEKTMNDMWEMVIIKNAIILELADIIKTLGGKSDILSIVNSFCDTLSDKQVLESLKEWNS
jgi:hypothetical protein